jgi:hypothetical protein
MIVIAAILSVQAAKAAGPEEDRALDLKASIEAARDIEIPAPPKSSHNGRKYFSRDCAHLELGAGEGIVESDKARLTTQEFTEICKPVPAGDTGLIIEHCFHQPGQAWTRSVSLLARPRPLPPGTKEVFEVCVEGEKTELTPITVLNTYTVEKTGETNVLFILTPIVPPAVNPAPPPADDRQTPR